MVAASFVLDKPCDLDVWMNAVLDLAIEKDCNVEFPYRNLSSSETALDKKLLAIVRSQLSSDLRAEVNTIGTSNELISYLEKFYHQKPTFAELSKRWDCIHFENDIERSLMMS